MRPKLGPYELNTIVTGDCRELAKAIPNESVDLIFTDPVYQNIDDYRWLAETAARVLKEGGWCLTYYGIGYLPQTVRAMEALVYDWHHVDYMPTLNARGAYRTFSNYRGLLRYRKGKARPYKHIRDLHKDTYDPHNNGHEWAKNLNVIADYIATFSLPGMVVVDLFSGNGTTPLVCRMLDRNWLAFEIIPEVAERARERVRNTQPPLFTLAPEQQEMPL